MSIATHAVILSTLLICKPRKSPSNWLSCVQLFSYWVWQMLQTVSMALPQKRWKKWRAPTPDFDHLLLALMHAENATIAMAECIPWGQSIYLWIIRIYHCISWILPMIPWYKKVVRRLPAPNKPSPIIWLSLSDVLNIQNIPEMLRQVSGAVRHSCQRPPVCLANWQVICSSVSATAPA